MRKRSVRVSFFYPHHFLHRCPLSRFNSTESAFLNPIASKTEESTPYFSKRLAVFIDESAGQCNKNVSLIRV